jgi:peptidoglycan LD-endopeptidase CwlK
MDATSEQRLALVHPTLAAKVQAAFAALSAQGTYFCVAQGLRTYAEQDALYAQGRTTPGHIVTNARGGYSNHNFGCAVDCYPYLSGPGGAINWSANSPQFRAMVSALESQGLTWGGSWTSLPDAPHFQLENVPVTPTNADRQAFATGNLQAVWAMYDPAPPAVAGDGTVVA